MNSIIRSCLAICLLVLATPILAGKNPIAWQLSGSFQNPVFSQASYSVTYTFTNQLPSKLVNALEIRKAASPANEFTYVDNCTGQFLNAGQSCTVQITLVPIAAGQKSVQLTIAGYSKDRVPVPALTTQLVGNGSLVDVLGFVNTSFPSSLTVGTSANYLFTFTNNSGAAASGVSIQSSDINSSTSCRSTLAAGSSCTVSGNYTPVSISPSIQTVSATLNYSQGSPVTVSTSTAVPQATGIVGHFVSPNYLPAAMIPGSRPIQIVFQNFGPTAIGTITSNPASMVAVSGGDGTGTFTYTGGTPPTAQNNCTGTLSVGAACQVTGTFTAANASATPYVVTATLTYTGVTGSPTVETTSTTVVSSLSTSRTVTFVNDCTFAVWFSLSGGQLTSASCNGSGVGCPPGTSCDTTNGNCYWTNYAPGDNNFKLESQGNAHSTNTVTIQATSADPAIQWSGTMAASLACTAGSACLQADCGNSAGLSSVGACAAGTGFSPPVTQAEITMNLSQADSYDVEVINGFTVPVSIVPGPFVTPSNYSCGWPGYSNASSVPSGFGACNWTAQGTPPSNAYYWVTTALETGGLACNPLTPSCSGSPSGQICGLDVNLNPVCGNFLGYWTADEACGKNATAADPYFFCNTPVTGTYYPAGSTLSDLMLCKVPKGSTSPTFNSCYQTYPTSLPIAEIDTCCGCVDWWTDGVTGVNSTAQSCTQAATGITQANSTWLDTSTSGIITKIKWLKTACPSDYTYTFDDATSGFSCSNNLPGSSNSVGYTVTFCPPTGASTFDTGLPTGVPLLNDGRGSF